MAKGGSYSFLDMQKFEPQHSKTVVSVLHFPMIINKGGKYTVMASAEDHLITVGKYIGIREMQAEAASDVHTSTFNNCRQSKYRHPKKKKEKQFSNIIL